MSTLELKGEKEYILDTIDKENSTIQYAVSTGIFSSITHYN